MTQARKMRCTLSPIRRSQSTTEKFEFSPAGDSQGALAGAGQVHFILGLVLMGRSRLDLSHLLMHARLEGSTFCTFLERSPADGGFRRGSGPLTKGSPAGSCHP